MLLPLKTSVTCTDGVAGTTNHVVLKLETGEVTHIVVSLAGHRNELRMVPVTYLAESTPDSIHLNCSRADLAALPSFTKPTYVEEDVPIYLSSGAYTTAPVVALKYHERKREAVEQVPEDEVALDQDARGQTREGHIGRTAAVTLDPATHQITGLILREGRFWGQKQVCIPISAIDFFDEDAVYLKWDKARVAQLPPLPDTEA